jgi:hypothetical protein
MARGLIKVRNPLSVVRRSLPQSATDYGQRARTSISIEAFVPKTAWQVLEFYVLEIYFCLLELTWRFGRN